MMSTFLELNISDTGDVCQHSTVSISPQFSYAVDYLNAF